MLNNGHVCSSPQVVSPPTTSRVPSSWAP
jgi:hypothetical protein